MTASGAQKFINVIQKPATGKQNVLFICLVSTPALFTYNISGTDTILFTFTCLMSSYCKPVYSALIVDIVVWDIVMFYSTGCQA